jgi:hypothetical protein
MSLEAILFIIVVVSIGAVIIFLSLARRAVRLAIRLGLVLVLMLVLGGAAVTWYWFGGSNSSATPQTRPANTRRGNSR